MSTIEGAIPPTAQIPPISPPPVEEEVERKKKTKKALKAEAKLKKTFVWTPAREAAFKKCQEARSAKLKEKREQKPAEVVEVAE